MALGIVFCSGLSKTARTLDHKSSKTKVYSKPNIVHKGSIWPKFRKHFSLLEGCRFPWGPMARVAGSGTPDCPGGLDGSADFLAAKRQHDRH